MKRTLSISVAILAAGLLGGCYQYVNIPADSGDVAMHSVNADHVVDAEYEALKAVVRDTGMHGQYLIALPFNTFPKTYEHLCARLGGGAMSVQSTSQPNLPTLEVAHVYIRGFSGSVDIIRPADLNDLSGARQLVTVYMKLYPVGGWGVQRIDVWRMSVEKALIESRNASSSDSPPPAPAPESGPGNSPTTAPAP